MQLHIRKTFKGEIRQKYLVHHKPPTSSWRHRRCGVEQYMKDIAIHTFTNYGLQGSFELKNPLTEVQTLEIGQYLPYKKA